MQNQQKNIQQPIHQYNQYPQTHPPITSQSMQFCLDKVLTHILPILTYSGHSVMRLGNYNECILADGMDYNTVFLSGVGSTLTSLYVSLCLPVQCTPDIIKDSIDGLAQTMGYDLRVASVNNRIQDQQPPYTWVFFLTLTLIAILIALTLYSTLTRSTHRLLKSFSLPNTLKIFKYNPKSRLNVFNGVRSLAMLYVIFGHQYSLVIVNTSNLLTLNEVLYEWKQLFIEAGILAVDTFFFVGGFLVAYSVLKEDKVKTKLKYPLAILNRYLRFVPSYLMAILLYYSVMPHLVSGPFWYQNTPSIDKCDRMWKPLLFVDNLVDNGNSQCMGWGWYLQNDMQLFLFSMFVLLVYHKSRFWSFITLFVSIAGSFAFTMQQCYDLDFKYTTHLDDFATYGDYMSDIYIKPWSRCPPYMFGLFLGILYIQFLGAEAKDKIKVSDANKIDMDEEREQAREHKKHFMVQFKQYLFQNPWRRRMIQLTGIAICLFIVLIPRTAQGDKNHWSQLTHSLFLTYSKLAFIIGLTFLILPSLLGVEGLVRFTMDTKAFNFMGKISFWTYLIHLTIMFRWITSIQIDFYYAYVPLFVLFVSSATQSMLVGFVFCVLVEVPFVGLQKQLITYMLTFGSKGKAKSQIQHTKSEGDSHNNINASVAKD